MSITNYWSTGSCAAGTVISAVMLITRCCGKLVAKRDVEARQKVFIVNKQTLASQLFLILLLSTHLHDFMAIKRFFPFDNLSRNS